MEARLRLKVSSFVLFDLLLLHFYRFDRDAIPCLKLISCRAFLDLALKHNGHRYEILTPLRRLLFISSRLWLPHRLISVIKLTLFWRWFKQLVAFVAFLWFRGQTPSACVLSNVDLLRANAARTFSHFELFCWFARNRALSLLMLHHRLLRAVFLADCLSVDVHV
jgi:hypothetical protein